MNGIFNVSEFLFTILYADDTCVLMNGKHLENLVTRIQKELNLLYTWLQANKRSLNRQKTYYIIFHRARIKLTSHTSDLYMGDYILTATDKLKYIGIIREKNWRELNQLS